MRKAMIRLVLAVVVAGGAWGAVVRADDTCDWWWSVGYQGWQELNYTCGQTDCLVCYNNNRTCQPGCTEVYDRQTQHDEFDWCVQACHQSTTACYQDCTP